MAELKCYFVVSNDHNSCEKLICRVTKGEYSHAAIGIDIEGKPRIVHATSPAVNIQPGDHFDDYEKKEVITFQITEEQRIAVVERAFELVGKKYGFDDCIESGMKDLGIAEDIGEIFGDAAEEFVQNLLNDPKTFNCSSSQVEMVRAAFPEFAPGVESTTVSPEASRLMLKDFYNTLYQGGN